MRATVEIFRKGGGGRRKRGLGHTNPHIRKREKKEIKDESSSRIYSKRRAVSGWEKKKTVGRTTIFFVACDRFSNFITLADQRGGLRGLSGYEKGFFFAEPVRRN